RIWPVSLRITPAPVEEPVVISTTLGATAAATSATLLPAWTETLVPGTAAAEPPSPLSASVTRAEVPPPTAAATSATAARTAAGPRRRALPDGGSWAGRGGACSGTGGKGS